MAKDILPLSSENSWRTITQSGLKGVSVHAKKRHFSLRLKAYTLFGGFMVLVGMLIFGIYFYKKYSLSEAFMPLVKHFEVQSNGALTEFLLVPLIGLRKDVGIMNVDIFDMQRRLESLMQVREATIERKFPDAIKITINEYLPIVKVVTVNECGKRKGLLISKEGHVFRGYGYSSKQLRQIPYLTGIQLYKSGKAFSSVPNMDRLDELLRCAQLEVPQLYKYWKSISLTYCQNENIHLGSFIKVRTRNLGELIFSPEKFELQLDRLKSIVVYASEQKLATIERIDLSMGNQAIVKVMSN